MCKAFSCVCLKNGDVKWVFGKDSHDEILRHFKIQDNEDFPKFARVEITPNNGNYMFPDAWTLRVDERVRPKWFTKGYEAFCMDEHAKWQAKLDTILVKRKILNPLTEIAPPRKIAKKHLDLLKKCASMRDSVWASVWASVWDSVGDSVGASVRASVGDSVWASVGSLFKLARDQWKYTDKIKTKGYPFQCYVDLWNIGLVPSFDGEAWQLHGGPEAEILWEGKLETEKQ